MAQVGPLLRQVLERIDNAPDLGLEMNRLEAQVGPAAGDGRLPVVMQLPNRPPFPGEHWLEYKKRLSVDLNNANAAIGGGAGEPLYLANAVTAALPPHQLRALAQSEIVERVELDPVFDATLMDDAIDDVGSLVFRAQNNNLDGSGVRVAVLDSGIDTAHPFLKVQQSLETCGEPIALPGSHGTHCAGSIASQDTIFQGIAPGVTLLNVKVLRSNGSGTPGYVSRGVDAAMDLDADILSISIGFNHLPSWSDRGHGWSCPAGACQLCTAVQRAVQFGKHVIVAAGNEHDRAEALRQAGFGNSFDTEISCPGQAPDVVTVAALTKRTFAPASFSSRGPTAYNTGKPDLAGPGVNITSTVPAPRAPTGVVLPMPSRANLFDRKSGTSMATPIVAGAAALILEAARANGNVLTPAQMKTILTTQTIFNLGPDLLTYGAGRIDMR